MAKISFYFKDTPVIHINQNFLKEAIKKIAGNENSDCGELNIVFCRDAYLLEINQSFLNHDYYTDIITFDYSQENKIAGELYISIERVEENAKLFKEPFRVELIRVIFHGILHLLGYKDKEKAEIAEMREKEQYYISFFNVKQ